MLMYGKSESLTSILLIQTCFGLQTWRFYFLLQGLLMPKNQIASTFRNFGWALFGIMNMSNGVILLVHLLSLMATLCKHRNEIHNHGMFVSQDAHEVAHTPTASECADSQILKQWKQTPCNRKSFESRGRLLLKRESEYSVASWLN